MAMSVEEISAQFVKNDVIVSDCNKFVQAVAAKIGTEYGMSNEAFSKLFAGNADAIRGRFDSAPFIFIGSDKAAADKATKLAEQGNFVIGGLSAKEMKLYEPTATLGHVVVIVPGGLSKPIAHMELRNGKQQPARGGYPYCYQGAHLSQYRFKNRTQVDAVFPKLSLDHINYAYIPLKK